MFGRRGAAPEIKPVCRFWKAGHCRFGKDCKFRHEDDSGPGPTNTNTNTGWNSNSNINNNNNNAANNFRNNNRSNRHNPFMLDKEAIRADLTPGEEKPEWPLSCYGPGRDAPLQLMEGEYEMSPEEMRVQCYLALANGRMDEYVKLEGGMESKAKAEAGRIVREIDEAIKYVQDGQGRADNRIAQVTTDARAFQRDESTFGRPSQVAPPTGLSTFGHTSHPNQNPAFPSGLGPQGGYNAPEQPSLGSRPAFGQSSLIGSSAFGQASQPTSTFGQPSQPKPTFGQPSQPTSTFGQSSQPAPAFGQPPQSTPAFGQPSQPSSTFGQPTQSTPAFGQPSQPTSTFGQPSQPAPAFGQPSQPTSAFGKASVPTQNQPTSSGGFGGRQRQQSSPFGGGGGTTQNQSGTNSFGFGKPSAPANNIPTGPRQPFAPQSQQNTTSRFDGQGAQQPAAAPAAAPAPMKQEISNPRHPGTDPDAEGPPSAYEGELGKALKDVYQAVWQSGRFGDVVPEIPPKREWLNFNV